MDVESTRTTPPASLADLQAINTLEQERQKAWRLGYSAGQKASQQAAQAVPEGWQLVPVEPTPIMVEAMVKEADRQESLWMYDGAEFCRAMLRAAKGEQ